MKACSPRSPWIEQWRRSWFCRHTTYLNLPTISEGEQGQGATKHQGDCVERYAIKGGCPLHADWGRFVFYRFLLPPALLAAPKWGKHISGKRRCGTQSDRNCEDEGGAFAPLLSSILVQVGRTRVQEHKNILAQPAKTCANVSKHDDKVSVPLFPIPSIPFMMERSDN